MRDAGGGGTRGGAQPEDDRGAREALLGAARHADAAAAGAHAPACVRVTLGPFRRQEGVVPCKMCRLDNCSNLLS